MTPKDQARMANFILESVIELRRRLQERHDAGGTSTPDFAGTSIVFVLVDESSGDVTIVCDGEQASTAVASLLSRSLDQVNANAQKGKSSTQKKVLQ